MYLYLVTLIHQGCNVHHTHEARPVLVVGNKSHFLGSPPRVSRSTKLSMFNNVAIFRPIAEVWPEIVFTFEFFRINLRT